MEQPVNITARWARPRPQEIPKLYLVIGHNLSLILSVEEVRDLGAAIAGAFRELGVSFDEPPEQTDN